MQETAASNAEPKTEGKENLDELLKRGPNVYQLYAVLIHRGGVSGGHYFAFIRDLETQQWYRFDDTTVRRVFLNMIFPLLYFRFIC